MAAASRILLFLCLSALHLRSGACAEDGAAEDVPYPDLTSAPVPEAEIFLTSPMEPGSASEAQQGLPTSTLQPSGEDVASPGGTLATGAEGQVLEEPPNPSESREEEEDGRGCEKGVPPERVQEIAEAMMKFAADLLREVEKGDIRDNFFFSPLSISLALSHLALGAANQTEKHLLEVLHMESVPCLHHALHSIYQQLDKTTLSIAARLYLQKEFQVKEKFLEDSERFYGAKPATLSGENEADLAAINNWVKEATDGQISSILSELPSSAVMVLLNAVHFQGFWRNKFDPNLTEPNAFHLDDEFTVSVEMMTAWKYSLSWFTLDSLDVQVARFPFKGNTSFVTVVPNDFERNVSQLLSDLSQANLHSHFPKERPTIVKMPKLHLQCHLKLNQALDQLGLGELFSSPDFRHIAEKPLFVSAIEHQSALELAEAGVEASAATSVVMSRSLSTFSLNRPFFFIIIEDKTRIPLFFGSIRNPNASAPRQRKERQDSPDPKQAVRDSIPK